MCPGIKKNASVWVDNSRTDAYNVHCVPKTAGCVSVRRHNGFFICKWSPSGICSVILSQMVVAVPVRPGHNAVNPAEDDAIYTGIYARVPKKRCSTVAGSKVPLVLKGLSAFCSAAYPVKLLLCPHVCGMGIFFLFSPPCV